MIMDINENEEQVLGEVEPTSTEPNEIETSPVSEPEDADLPSVEETSLEAEEMEEVEEEETDPASVEESSLEADLEEADVDSVEEVSPEEDLEDADLDTEEDPSLEAEQEEADLPSTEETLQEEDLEEIEAEELDSTPEEIQPDMESVEVEEPPILEEEQPEEEPAVADPEPTSEESIVDEPDDIPEPEEDISVELEEGVDLEEEADQISERKPVAVPVKDDGRAWYVVHCYSGNEDKVRHNIMQRIESMSMDDLIFDVVVPTEDEVNIKNGERQTIEKKVFPGYILVNMILTEESWYMVRNTPGVTGFVGMGNDPTPLQPEEVARILKRMESESPRINVTFRPGERVRIVDGPFEDFYGKVAEIDMERATVRVMVNFFGRETPVELDFLQVEEA
jgi:transcriptional antiterminator NusG